MEKEIVKLVGELNEKLYGKEMDIVNNFSYVSDGLYFFVKYGGIVIASDYDVHFNYSIEEVKKMMKNNMNRLLNDIKSDLELLNG